ncbi:succinyl-diaminopimelate desuccinylase [Bdellovibrio sp. qaytius]|nr:succinyl-diaminopimelate desuccinylase [Bdellovibrio sp. qaytius]
MSELQVSSVEGFDFIGACRKLIAIDSSPQISTVELVDYLALIAYQFGFDVEIQQAMQNGIAQSNIIVRLQPFQAGQNEFLLQAHLDTVDPGNFALWKKNNFNPFDAVIEDGRIYGLGSAEVKLDFLCKLVAMAQFKDKKLNTLQPVLVGTFGEETGMQGALKLIRKNKINAKYALIGDASDLKIINAAKGYATVQMRIPFASDEVEYKRDISVSESMSTQSKVFSGKSAHSSTPHLGESAAVKLFEYLAKMPDNVVIVDMDAGTRVNMIPNQAMVELDIATSIKDPAIRKINFLYAAMNEVQTEMKSVVDKAFTPEHSTISIGIIRTLEDHILIGGSCRILPNVKQEVYEKWMKMISTACEKVGAEFHLQDYKRPFRTDEKSVLIKGALAELEKLGQTSPCTSLASTNEASLFSRIGIECICVGPGKREDNVHTPNEHVEIKHLELMTSFYQRMIERFCL